jgi:hypothetical protein
MIATCSFLPTSEVEEGDKMSVHYKVEDQENVAQSVTVEWDL